MCPWYVFTHCSRRLKVEFLSIIQMDLGVGSFVFSQGVVSAIPILKDPVYLSSSPAPKILRTIKKTLPLIFLGIVRVIMVKGVEYPVRPHWCSCRNIDWLNIWEHRNMSRNTGHTGTFSSHWRYCPLCKCFCILISRIFQYLYSVS